MKRTIILTLCLTAALAASADHLKYGREQLSQAGRQLAIAQHLPETGTAENVDTVLRLNGNLISVRVEKGTVTHIGCHIFHPATRRAVPSPVYDYLEFACLDHKLSLTENPFVYQNVKFTRGDWQKLAQMPDTVACAVTRIENVSYHVEWKRGGETLMTVSFPVGYAQLYMMPRRDIERKFLDELVDYQGNALEEVQAQEDQLAYDKTRDLWVLKGNSYLISQVTDNLYFRKDSVYGMMLVWDKKNPAESMANMLVSGDKWLTGIPVEFGTTTHDLKKETLHITMRQLIGYARQTGCQAYWGCDTVEPHRMAGTLFLYNPAYGYDHVVNIVCDPSLIGTNDFHIQAYASLFAPTTNIKNLFAKSKGMSSHKIIEEK